MRKEIVKGNVAACQVPFCGSERTKPKGGGTKKGGNNPAGKPLGTVTNAMT